MTKINLEHLISVMHRFRNDHRFYAEKFIGEVVYEIDIKDAEFYIEIPGFDDFPFQKAFFQSFEKDISKKTFKKLNKMMIDSPRDFTEEFYGLLHEISLRDEWEDYRFEEFRKCAVAWCKENDFIPIM